MKALLQADSYPHFFPANTTRIQVGKYPSLAFFAACAQAGKGEMYARDSKTGCPVISIYQKVSEAEPTPANV